MKALIKVGYSCNNHCTFCHTSELRPVDDTALGVHRKIRRAADLGHTMVVLSGGEPTIRPQLLEWARHTAGLGMDFGLVTNGRMLSYPALVDRLMARRLAYVYLSLHGGTAKVHDAMVRAPAFEETVAAIDVLGGRGLDLTVNCVVTRTNLDHLDAIVDRLAHHDDLVLKFSMAEPKGAAGKRFDAVIPRVSEVADQVRAAIRRGASRAPGLRFSHDGIPFCLLEGQEHLYDDLKTHDFASMSEVHEPDFFPVDDRARLQPPRCEGCRLRGACPGLYRAYYEQHTDSELEPRHGPRSNAFHYVHERDLRWPTGGPCPQVTDGTSPYDRGRQLFVLDGERMGQYRTRTRDFSDEEIATIKWERGQIYVDRTVDKVAVDDFAADLRLLQEAEACASCPSAAECPRCFSAVASDVFASAEAPVRDLLGELEGDVLDIGCGEGRYAAALATPASQGRVRYRAVEPDSELAAAFRARHPWATVDERAIEDVDVAPESLDWALILRSWNHLRRPAAVLGMLAAALRPGGSLLIVDNTAFAVVRTAEQAERAERSDAAFEHYRNDTLAQARAQAEAVGLRAEEARPVRRGGSNQWVLRLRRPRAEEAL